MNSILGIIEYEKIQMQMHRTFDETNKVNLVGAQNVGWRQVLEIRLVQ